MTYFLISTFYTFRTSLHSQQTKTFFEKIKERNFFRSLDYSRCVNLFVQLFKKIISCFSFEVTIRLLVKKECIFLICLILDAGADVRSSFGNEHRRVRAMPQRQLTASRSLAGSLVHGRQTKIRG